MEQRRCVKHLDLPNITPAVAEMSVAEFDAWVSGLTNGGYGPITADEMSERTQLEALQELLAERRELRRLQVRIDLEKEIPTTTAPQRPNGTPPNSSKKPDAASANLRSTLAPPDGVLSPTRLNS